jgi:hypothetical protein
MISGTIVEDWESQFDFAWRFCLDKHARNSISSSCVHKPKYYFTILIGGSPLGWGTAKVSILPSRQEGPYFQCIR